MSFRGRLLVAQPDMLDPNFHQTVIFLIEHNADGALGVVLNRPLDLLAEEHAADWSDRLAEPGVIFSGGPVGQGGALALGECPDAEAPGFVSVQGQLGLVELDVASPGVTRMRLFSGYAGWGGGQIEGELASDSWFVVDAEIDDAFTRDPSGLWSAVLKRQGGDLARLAFYPPDPGLN